MRLRTLKWLLAFIVMMVPGVGVGAQNLYTESFEGVTVPALPVGFTVSASTVTFASETGTVNGGTQAVSCVTSAASTNYLWGSNTTTPIKSDVNTTGTKGDDSFTTYVYFATATSQQGGVMFRLKGDPTTNTNTFYLASIQPNSGLTLKWRNSSGTLASAGGSGTVGAAAFAISTWYKITGRAIGTTISCQVEQITGANAGKWIDSSGAWSSGSAIDAISTTDTNLANGTTSFGGVRFQCNATSTTYIDDLSFDQAAAAGAATGISLTGPTSGTYNVAQVYTVSLNPPGSTSAGVTVTLADSLGSTITGNAPSLTTASPSANITVTPTATGTHVISETNGGSLTNASNISDVVTYATINPGTIVPSLSSITSTQIVLTVTGATGNASLSYQWAEATDPNSTFTNVGTSSTTLTRTGLTAGTQRWYKVTVSDGLASPVTSQVQPSNTYDSAMVLGCLGDSIMAYDHISGTNITMFGVSFSVSGTESDRGANATGSLWSTFVASMTNRHITPISVTNQNYGAVGASSGDFDSGGVAASLLISGASGFQTAGVTHLILMLGANDAKASTPTYATYKTNVQNIITYLFANVSTLTKIVVFPPYPWNPQASAFSTSGWGGGATAQTANSFIQSCNSIGVDMAAAFPGTVFDGGTELFHVMSNAPLTWYDTAGIHPTNVSAPTVAQIWAKGFVKAIFGTTTAANVGRGRTLK